MTLALLIVVCCLTYSFEAIFGLAGTILMMPIGVLIMDAKTLVIFALLPQLASSTVVLSTSAKKINQKLLVQMFILAAIGALIGLWVFSQISSDLLKLVLGISITIAGLLMLLTPNTKLPLIIQKVLERVLQ